MINISGLLHGGNQVDHAMQKKTENNINNKREKC